MLQRRLVFACLVAGQLAVSAASAQRSPSRPSATRNIPFSDPNDFFDQLFGRESASDREALAKVKISVREEHRVGQRTAESYLENLKRRGIKVVTRGRDVQDLQSLVNLLRVQMQNRHRYDRIRVYFADSPATDACSFSGGHLVFFRGLLDFADSEAALVGVVGHELSYLDRGHQLGGVRRMKLAQQSFSTARRSPQRFWEGGRQMMQMFTRPFRPEDESQADQDGITWAHRAGYDPRKMAEMFYRMHHRDRGEPTRRIPDFLRTHPYHLDRYRAAIDLCNELQSVEPKESPYIGRENLARRIPRSVRVFSA